MLLISFFKRFIIYALLLKKDLKKKNNLDEDFNLKMNSYLNKITNSINNFNLNVVVANVYEIFNLFSDHLNKEISNKCIKQNLTNLMKILIPFTPHIAYECLDVLGIKETKSWPKINTKLIQKEKIKMAIQINGKTRDVIEVEKGVNQKLVEKLCYNNKKIKEKVSKNSISKVIFVKDRIINFIIKV